MLEPKEDESTSFANSLSTLISHELPSEIPGDKVELGLEPKICVSKHELGAAKTCQLDADRKLHSSSARKDTRSSRQPTASLRVLPRRSAR